jgi:hypothetical protein
MEVFIIFLLSIIQLKKNSVCIYIKLYNYKYYTYMCILC